MGEDKGVDELGVSEREGAGETERGGDVYYWCGGFIEATFRHSLGSGSYTALGAVQDLPRSMGTGKGGFS